MNKKNETSMQLITKRLLQKRLTEDILGEDDIDMQVLIILAIGYNCKQMCSYRLHNIEYYGFFDNIFLI